MMMPLNKSLVMMMPCNKEEATTTPHNEGETTMMPFNYNITSTSHTRELMAQYDIYNNNYQDYI